MPARTASGSIPDDTVESILLRKQGEFQHAIERYGTVPFYRRAGLAVSVANMSLLVWLILHGLRGWSGFPTEAAALASAALVADFVNGVVHLIMDRASGYRSAIGPFVANFHLHHRIPNYRRRNLFAVWFLESGSKFWLVGYLAAVVWALPSAMGWSPAWAHFLVLVGVLSTWAEVSHYMCHTTRYRIQGFLERIGLVLSRSGHSRHHAEDNVDYAFLNGWTNPVLNRLAKLLSRGYKSTTDLHTAAYKTAERS